MRIQRSSLRPALFAVCPIQGNCALSMFCLSSCCFLLMLLLQHLNPLILNIICLLHVHNNIQRSHPLFLALTHRTCASGIMSRTLIAITIKQTVSVFKSSMGQQQRRDYTASTGYIIGRISEWQESSVDGKGHFSTTIRIAVDCDQSTRCWKLECGWCTSGRSG